MKNYNTTKISKICNVIILLYTVSALTMGGYYGYQKNGFDGLMEGNLLKGFAWPYFTFFHKTKQKIPNDATTALACHYQLSAPATKPKRPVQGDAQDYERFLTDGNKIFSKVLKQANTVNIVTLNNIYPGWGTHFEDDFRAGLCLIKYGFEKSNFEIIQASKEYSVRWEKWYRNNWDSLVKILSEKYEDVEIQNTPQGQMIYVKE